MLLFAEIQKRGYKVRQERWSNSYSRTSRRSKKHDGDQNGGCIGSISIVNGICTY